MEKKKSATTWRRRPKFRGHIKSATHIYKIAIMRCRIKKMPLLGLTCWPIHSDDVEMTWQWCGDSLQLNINVQAPKFASPKYLKIIKNEN